MCMGGAMLLVGILTFLWWKKRQGGQTNTGGASSSMHAPLLHRVLADTEGQRLLTVFREYGMDTSQFFAKRGRDGKLYVMKRQSDADVQRNLRIFEGANAKLKRIYDNMNKFDSYKPFFVPFVESHLSHIFQDVKDGGNREYAAWTDTVYWNWIAVPMPTSNYNAYEADVAFHLVLHEMAHVISKTPDHNFPFYTVLRNLTDRAQKAGVYDVNRLLKAGLGNNNIGQYKCQTTGDVIATFDDWNQLMSQLSQLGGGTDLGCKSNLQG